MSLQSFLEEERKEFDSSFNRSLASDLETDSIRRVKINNWLRSHDERLLGKVREEITARYEKRIHAEQFHGFNADRLKKDMEEILSSLNSK
ncbi:MAG TPA: hypothetical protein PKV66_00095 [Candidatus Pelethenecus sp.]|nr:hypothetical protein [Candidatus Pelethenecus sp.]